MKNVKLEDHAIHFGLKKNNSIQSEQNDSQKDIFAGLSDLAQKIYLERRFREKFFPGSFFGEPGWDLLLDIYMATTQDKNISITSACLGANVPTTTALRWISLLERHDMITRHDDPADNRRSFVRLTPNAYHRMTNFLFATLSKSKSGAWQ